MASVKSVFRFFSKFVKSYGCYVFFEVTSRFSMDNYIASTPIIKTLPPESLLKSWGQNSSWRQKWLCSNLFFNIFQGVLKSYRFFSGHWQIHHEKFRRTTHHPKIGWKVRCEIQVDTKNGFARISFSKFVQGGLKTMHSLKPLPDSNNNYIASIPMIKALQPDEKHNAKFEFTRRGKIENHPKKNKLKIKY